MSYVSRILEAEVAAAARTFPALVLTGPRRSGKTTLLRRLRPDAEYVLLEDPAVVARVRSDPVGFLGMLKPPVLLDEIQNAPELLAHVRARIDAEPKRPGRWFLTGSQEFSLMRGVSESMAGRAAIFQLLPLAAAESPRVGLLRGGFPEPALRPKAASTWFRSYIQTYLERDVRAVAAVRDLARFRTFLSLLAARTGQVLSRTDLAAPLGVSIPTISSWIDVLEVTGQILVVPPYFENFGKRLIKSPKIHLADPGLACHLLGIETEVELERSPFLGAIFEGFVAAEVAKLQAARGRRRELYHFRDAQGLEVDLLVPGRSGRLLAIEVKASRTAKPDHAEVLIRLSRALGTREADLRLVHRPWGREVAPGIVKPGVRAMGIEGLRDLV